MPAFRRRAPVIDADRVGESSHEAEETTDLADAKALAEEAEAEAAAAEAIAASARARARALKLRRLVAAAEATATGGAVGKAHFADAPADADTTEASETAPKSASTGEPATVLDEAVPVKGEDAAVTKRDETSLTALRRWLVRLNRKRIGTVLVALSTAALLVASGYMVWHHRAATHERQLKAEYAAAGRQSVVTLMSLDFNKAQDDVNRILDNSTGAFRDDFKNQAAVFAKQAQDAKVNSEVTVDSVAVESMTNDSATVLISATSRVTNAAGAKQEPRSWRLSVNLQREGGRVKMSKIEFVS